MRRWQWAILLVFLALLAAGGTSYWAFLRPSPPPVQEAPSRPLKGLDWLPTEAGLVIGADLAAIREQEWFLRLLQQVTEEAEIEQDYTDFVTATGFDYTRDLDRLWLGLYGPRERPHTVGIAEGRFSPEKIITHALSQGGRASRYQGFDIYQVDEPIRNRPGTVKSFAFAFLDLNRLVFGSDTEHVQRVLDSAGGRSPGVGSDEARRARAEAAAAGRQIWAVNELSRWVPSFLQDQESVLPLLEDITGGLAIGAKGIHLTASARCHEPNQARRLHDNLKLMLLAGRFMLGRDPDPLVRTLASALGSVRLYQQDRRVQAEMNLSQQQVSEWLLAPPAAEPTTPAAPASTNPPIDQ